MDKGCLGALFIGLLGVGAIVYLASESEKMSPLAQTMVSLLLFGVGAMYVVLRDKK